jgi:hypothetical protein
MPRQFLTRTEADEHDAVMEALAGRENELASYDANVVSYAQQLVGMDATLPPEWPAELVRLQGKSNEQIFAIGTRGDDAILASQLNHRERVRMLLFTETAERAKSETAYEHCLHCLPVDPVEKQAALDRYIAKEAAQRAKSP